MKKIIETVNTAITVLLFVILSSVAAVETVSSPSAKTFVAETRGDRRKNARR